MASSLNETNLEKKLSSVTNTQESIQTLSLWCLHHKAHYKKIVEMWIKVLKKAKPSHRLALYYLANDVIQNSKRKGNTNFSESWIPFLKESAPFMRDEKIKSQVERMFTIWETRSVYEPDLVQELKTALSTGTVKARPVANAKLLAEFKPHKLIDRIKKFKKAETETDVKQKQLTSLKIDVTSTEALRQLKDRAHGDKFSREFEEATDKLAEYVQAMEKEVQERTALIEVLEKGETFYDTQRGEAKIVANAYKNFGSRVKNLKRKLDEIKVELPSPVPSPTPDAPSPVDSSEPGSPPPEEDNKDNTEAVDMEMSDEEMESGTLRLEDPDVGSPNSAPSPEGSPDGLNLPNSPRNESSKEQAIGTIANQLAQGSSVMTSLLDSMSGSMLASNKKSSLDSRLSDLMQNIPNLSPAIHSSLFGDQGASPVPGLVASPLIGGSGTDGGGTPLKDEGSGTGSATPLQDEDREASDPIRLLNRIIKASGINQSVDSPLVDVAKGDNSRKPIQLNPANSWSTMQKVEAEPQLSKEPEDSIAEFFKKLGAFPPVNQTSNQTAGSEWSTNQASNPTPANSEWSTNQASNPTPASSEWSTNQASNATPVSSEWNTNQSNTPTPATSEWSTNPSNQISANSDWSRKQPEHAVGASWFSNSSGQPSPAYDQYSTSSSPNIAPVPSTPYPGLPPPPQPPPVIAGVAREEIQPISSSYTYSTNMSVITPTDSDEIVSNRTSSFSFMNNIPVSGTSMVHSDTLTSTSSNTYTCDTRMSRRNSSNDSDDVYARSTSYSYRPVQETDFYSAENCSGDDDEDNMLPEVCRPSQRNPNIVELTPSPDRSSSFNKESVDKKNSNLITIVQNNSEISVGSKTVIKNMSGPDRTPFMYNSNKGTLQLTPVLNTRSSASVNLRNIVPVETSNGKDDSDDTPSKNDYLGSSGALVADYPSDSDNEPQEHSEDTVLHTKESEQVTSAVPEAVAVPSSDAPTEVHQLTDETFSRIERIETVGGRRDSNEMHSFLAEADKPYSRRNDNFDRRPRFPPVQHAQRFNYQRREDNWEVRGGYDPYFHQRFPFRPPPKRFFHPRPDGRRQFPSPRY